MARFRAVSIERVRRELSNVEIVNIPGTHVDFPFHFPGASGGRYAALSEWAEKSL